MIDLKRFRKENQIKQEDIEAILDCSQSYVSALENGKKAITQEIYNTLYSTYKDKILPYITSEKEILPKGNKVSVINNSPSVPIYELGATAGNVEVYQDMSLQQPTGHLNIPGFEDCDFAMPVWGHSMYPTYENGAYVICRWVNDPAHINWGEAYYVEWADYRMIKRLVKGDNEAEVYLCSDNEAEQIAGRMKYSPIVVTKEELRKLALIKGVYKKTSH